MPARRSCGSSSPTVSSARGEYDRAIPLAREALSQAEEIEHLQWTAGTLRILGACRSTCSRLTWRASTSRRRTGSRSGSDPGVWIRWTAAPLAIARARTSTCLKRIDVLDRAARVAEVREDGSGRTARPVEAALTLGERQLCGRAAELALIEQRPDTALQIVDARLDVGACRESRERPGRSATLARSRRGALDARPVRGGRADARDGACRGDGAGRAPDAVEDRGGARPRASRAAKASRGASRVRHGARHGGRAGGEGAGRRRCARAFSMGWTRSSPRRRRRRPAASRRRR